MTKINISVLKPGMKFNQPVYMTPTSILVNANTMLSSNDIERLKRWNITEVETSGEILESPKIDYSFEDKHPDAHLHNELIHAYKKLHKIKNKFKNQYENSVKELRRVVDDIKENRNINNMKVYNISTDLISEVVSNPHIFIYLASKMSDENDYLPNHLINSAIYSIILGNLLKIGPKNMINLAASSLIYDIGMVKISPALLMKKEKLSPNELNLIKVHTIYGYKILIKDSSFPLEIATTALQHHEQFDGNGYPRKLKNDQIDLYSRIISIADAFEAMTKKRSYRNEFLSYDAMKTVLNQSKHKFDPNLIRLFLSNMSIYPIASLVLLNTNAVGMVIGSHDDNPLRPIIKIVIDEFGDKISSDEEKFIDLILNSEVFIKSAADEQEYNIDTFELI